MSSQYVIEPMPGYTLPHLKRNGWNIRNARLVKRGISGEIVDWHLLYSINMERYNPRPPAGMDKVEVLKIDGKEIVNEKRLSEDILYGNWNPHKLILFMSVVNKNRTMDEIEDYYFLDKRPGVPRVSKNVKKVNRIVEMLRKQGYMNMRENGELIKGDRNPPVDVNTKIPFKKDKEPVMNEIWEFVKQNSKVSADRIYNFISVKLGWLQTDNIFGKAGKQFEEYMKVMLDKGYLVDAGDNVYMVGERV